MREYIPTSKLLEDGLLESRIQSERNIRVSKEFRYDGNTESSGSFFTNIKISQDQTLSETMLPQRK